MSSLFRKVFTNEACNDKGCSALKKIQKSEKNQVLKEININHAHSLSTTCHDRKVIIPKYNTTCPCCENTPIKKSLDTEIIHLKR